MLASASPHHAQALAQGPVTPQLLEFLRESMECPAPYVSDQHGLEHHFADLNARPPFFGRRNRHLLCALPTIPSPSHATAALRTSCHVVDSHCARCRYLFRSGSCICFDHESIESVARKWRAPESFLSIDAWIFKVMPNKTGTAFELRMWDPGHEARDSIPEPPRMPHSGSTRSSALGIRRRCDQGPAHGSLRLPYTVGSAFFSPFWSSQKGVGPLSSLAKVPCCKLHSSGKAPCDT